MNDMKSKFAALFVAAVACLACPVQSPAQEKPSKFKEQSSLPDAETTKLAKQLMEASRVRKTLEESVGAMVAQGKSSAGDNAEKLPEGFWEELEKEMHKQIPSLMESLVPVYAKHFTKEELTALIEFYGTPAGKKLAEKQPLIMQESMVAGSSWGAKIGQEVAERLAKKKGSD
jgi:hypothetical protein